MNEMAPDFSFGRSEKLKSRKEIATLFDTGKSVGVFPVRMVYRFVPAEDGPGGLQVGVSASKRHFKKAVDRNRIKRLLREAFRLQQADLVAQLEKEGLNGFVFFMYGLKTLQKKAMNAHERPS